MLKLILKITGLVVAAGLLVFGVICLVAARDMHKKLSKMQKPLLEIPVDFSEPFELEAVLGPVEKYFHGLAIRIELMTTEDDDTALEALFAGLSGRASVTASDGSVIDAFSFEGGDVYVYGSETDQSTTVSFIYQFREYADDGSVFHLNIDQGAAGLKGIDHTLTTTCAGWNNCLSC